MSCWFLLWCDAFRESFTASAFTPLQVSRKAEVTEKLSAFGGQFSFGGRWSASVADGPGGLTRRSAWAILDGMKTIKIELPDGVFKWLTAMARKQKQTEAEVAQAALTAAANGRTPTLGDLAADLAGIGQGKYTDLSTNKKHMDDFGR